ncbi:LysE/ArgO family amino acid transporter [Helicobacter burdigaliensis]|uniref:LysE/ArgO family amino acid transporter n=1 Tax=Helicobacter burdigaliensis TaxID=2315334 RepID=UPI000EF69DD2|nr:LysE family transporter [Helicobacter burdigaliensis]
MDIAITGFLLAFSLFAGIGAQNIFVLKQGIMKNHILWVCLCCIACDIILVNLGIFGVGELISKNKIFMILLGVIGALFVFSYGLFSLKSAFEAKSFNLSFADKKHSLKKTLLQTLTITLINPHVYLDTIVILGANSLRYDFSEKAFFSLGIISASCAWFLCLGFASFKASEFFKKPLSWVIVNLLSAGVMFFIAYGLFIFVLEEIKLYF